MSYSQEDEIVSKEMLTLVVLCTAAAFVPCLTLLIKNCLKQNKTNDACIMYI